MHYLVHITQDASESRTHIVMACWPDILMPEHQRKIKIKPLVSQKSEADI
jgi:hypothetical protein